MYVLELSYILVSAQHIGRLYSDGVDLLIYTPLTYG